MVLTLIPSLGRFPTLVSSSTSCYRRGVTVHPFDKNKLNVLLSRQEIAAAVERVASEIHRDYHQLIHSQVHPELRSQIESLDSLGSPEENAPSRKAQGDPALLIGILKGAFVFMADLVRALEMPISLDFVRISTYGHRTQAIKEPKIVQGIRSPIKDRHVLVVEDIVDTGITTRFLLDYLKRRGAKSVRLCALLSKPARRQVDVHIDYLGFTIPNVFMVGYGTDLAERYRHLPDICILEDE